VMVMTWQMREKGRDEGGINNSVLFSAVAPQAVLLHDVNASKVIIVPGFGLLVSFVSRYNF
jgi:hypothetical protein